MSRRDCLKSFACLIVASAVLALGLQAMAADSCVKPFNEKDTTGWKVRGKAEQSKWVVGAAKLKAAKPTELEVTPGGKELVNAVAHSLDLYTEANFGDVMIELELMVPKGSNSGVYLMGEYEIQVLDSFGKTTIGPGDMGGIYHTAAPKVNASKAPGEWQKLVVDFRAPKFDAAGKKTANAKFVKVVLNDQVIHENVEALKSTGGGITGKEHATGPLMFQGNHGAVSFRNIVIKPLSCTK